MLTRLFACCAGRHPLAPSVSIPPVAPHRSVHSSPADATIGQLSCLQADAGGTVYASPDRRRSLDVMLECMDGETGPIHQAVETVNRTRPVPANRRDVRQSMAQDEFRKIDQSMLAARRQRTDALRQAGHDPLLDTLEIAKAVAAEYEGTQNRSAYCGEYSLMCLHALRSAGVAPADMARVQVMAYTGSRKPVTHEFVLCRIGGDGERRPLDGRELSRCLATGTPLVALDLWRAHGKRVIFRGQGASAAWRQHCLEVLRELEPARAIRHPVINVLPAAVSKSADEKAN